ncbi:AIM24 [Candida pseudojiufengensis]|uniref:AIM24 n=1 Tax=Candida pseudojiufengensis TaxID=497109 RepID=UPI002224D95C|nr:AIM24 [Candida pseudojiufengensis]KAI5959618.1 AIM24 [Candida pseudojiufengensis]
MIRSSKFQIINQLTNRLLNSSSITTKRYISINQFSNNTEDTKQDLNELNQTTTNLENIQNVNTLVPYKTIETAKFKTIEIPPTLLSIDSPPSVPIYLKRGSLISIFGLKNYNNTTNNSISNIRNTIEYPHFWQKLWLFNGLIQPFQKIISTIPFSILVSTNTKITTLNEKTFINLIIDGKTDWAILNPNSIHVYTGNSLIITLHSIPKFISKQLSKQLKLKKRIETGLKSFKTKGYSLVSGRGQIALTGNGEIYQINLKQDEEIILNKNFLLGITVNGPFDLENCILIDNSLSNSISTNNPIIKSPAKDIDTNVVVVEDIDSKKPIPKNQPVLVQPSAWDQIKISFAKTKAILHNISNHIHHYYNILKLKWNNFYLGNSQFIKIIGPRNILIQSSPGINSSLRQSIFSNSSTTKKIKTYEQIISEPITSKSNLSSKDYLSYVTIDSKDNNVKFENTPNFKDSIEEIEKSSKK